MAKKKEVMVFTIHYDRGSERAHFIVEGYSINETTAQAFKVFRSLGIVHPEKVNAKSERIL